MSERDDAWMADAACAGHEHPEWWWTFPGRPGFAEAQAICNGCPVVETCTAWGKARNEHGRWGRWVRLHDKVRAILEGEFVCEGCRRSFSTARGLKAHHAAKHCGVPPKLLSGPVPSAPSEVERFELEVDALHAQWSALEQEQAS